MWYLLILVPVVLLVAWLLLRRKSRPTAEELQILDGCFRPICRAACLAPAQTDTAAVNIAQLIEEIPQDQRVKVSGRAEMSYTVLQSGDAFIHLATVVQTTDGRSDALAFNLCLKLMERIVELISSVGESPPSLTVGRVGTKGQGLQFSLSPEQQQRLHAAISSKAKS